MSLITSVTDGDWHDADTWDYGIPAASDSVVIDHNVTVSADIYAQDVLINDGSLKGDAPYADSSLTAYDVNIKQFRMTGLPVGDTREVYLRGALFSATDKIPSISCIHATVGDYLATGNMTFAMGDDTFMTDPGGLGYSSVLEDMKSEGKGVNGSLWRQGNPPYVQVKMKWRRDDTHAYEEHLRRMTYSPYQVLIFTGSVLLKGHIETAVLDQDCVGTSYIGYTISVVRGDV